MLFSTGKIPLSHDASPGKRKRARPLVRKRPIHLILKSRYILLTHRGWIEEKFVDYGIRFGVRIHNQSINGDHIHFVIQVSHRDFYVKFIRALTSIIARKMGRGIWLLAPFTRIADWGRSFEVLMAYVDKNRDETWLRRKYEPRRYRKKFPGIPRPLATLSPAVTNALS